MRGHARGVGWASRTLWGAASNDQLSQELEVDSPVPLFDGAKRPRVLPRPIPPLASRTQEVPSFPPNRRRTCFPMDSSGLL